jgi:hypothetical protein
MRDSVEELEGELRSGDSRTAVLRAESLAAELLAAVASRAALPAAERQPLALAMALGLPGERWLWLSTLVGQARNGEPVGHAEALEAFALVLEVCRLSRR